MRRFGLKRWVLPPTAEKEARPGTLRDRVAVLAALATVLCFGILILVSKGNKFLMPGPLASGHGGIGACSSCHTKSGQGKLSFVHGLVAGDPLADSTACLTCHKMPDTAFNAHGATAEALKNSTERLTKVAAGFSPPISARAQDAAFPAREVVARDLYCATCHQEHKGVNFKLNEMSNAQCRACHIVKFDSFDGSHPKFEAYPFKRRTRVVYDHTAHFAKHYPDVAKKDQTKQIPDTCSACHSSGEDKRIMAVLPFEKTCATCHLDQITGKERASGPKGIAFLALPGLDLKSLKAKGARIGEWPENSEAALTPFMKVMISRSEKGQALLATAGGLDLQDLAAANDEQIKAVTDLVWEIKSLFHALIAGKASGVLGDLGIGGGAKPSAALVADLTASIPRDVVATAQEAWLPNLATEMEKGPLADSGASTAAIEAAPNAGPVVKEDAEEKAEPEKAGREEGAETTKGDASAEGEGKTNETARGNKLDRPPCLVSILGQCLVSKGAKDQPDAAKPEASDVKQKQSFDQFPGRMNAGLGDVAPAEQTDELLSPNEDEQREITAREKAAGKSGASSEKSGGAEPAPNAEPSTTGASAKAAPQISIQSDVDPESWAEYGGWYRQDHAIFYRPVGHKDKFIHAWLFLTGPQAQIGDASPAAAVFDALTGKDAQGSCTKCHSIDALPGKGRVVNFAQAKIDSKEGRFTRFIHEPHLSIKDDRGCLTCHAMAKIGAADKGDKADMAETAENAAAAGKDQNAEKESPYLKSYEHGNPLSFASNFGAVKKELCRTCHKSGQARQDCLTCHKYHVNGVVTPAMSTKLTAE